MYCCRCCHTSVGLGTIEPSCTLHCSTPDSYRAIETIAMSDIPSAEDALAKAKLIAARLSGQVIAAPAAASEPVTDESAPASRKRKRWGVAADEATTEASATLLPPKRVWIALSEARPYTHYASYCHEYLPSISEKLKTEHGDTVQVSLAGRGSSAAPPLPGMPEQPLHVVIEGCSDKKVLEAVETAVESLLYEAERAELRVSEDDTVDNSQALVTTAHAVPSNTPYKPATVATMLGHNTNNGTNGAPPEDWLHRDISVPNGVVGFIIGRGGEHISSMQARTGAKVQLEKESAGNAAMRKITISAPTQTAIDECKDIIETMVREKSSQLKEDATLVQARAQGHTIITVLVPDDAVGLVIGKQGATIQQLQDQSGAYIQVPERDAPNAIERGVIVAHPTPEGAEYAKQLILQTVAGHKSNNGGARTGGGADQVTEEVQVGTSCQCRLIFLLIR